MDPIKTEQQIKVENCHTFPVLETEFASDPSLHSYRYSLNFDQGFALFVELSPVVGLDVLFVDFEEKCMNQANIFIQVQYADSAYFQIVICFKQIKIAKT